MLSALGGVGAIPPLCKTAELGGWGLIPAHSAGPERGTGYLLWGTIISTAWWEETAWAPMLTAQVMGTVTRRAGLGHWDLKLKELEGCLPSAPSAPPLSPHIPLSVLFQTLLPYRFISFWDRGLYIKWHVIDGLHNPDLHEQSEQWVRGHQGPL